MLDLLDLNPLSNDPHQKLLTNEIDNSLSGESLENPPILLLSVGHQGFC
jgi:hypothetical protein